ncbi:unnamed protein product [Euphydryas editha]|uniref:Uncharacterized protein n=1 Tax=Euphydryas editha TaxID=104508 RepID=A0AAU9UDM1_EUPED|nr:unnamed protein product [Euphydryas editha]
MEKSMEILLAKLDEKIGKKELDKNRPVVVSLTTKWKKHMILRNRSNLQEGVYIKEDYPKEIIEKRKQLQLQVEEEKKKGIQRSPKIPSQKKVIAGNTQSTLTNLYNAPSKTTTKEIIRPNIMNYVERGRSASLSNLSKN